MSDRPAHDQDLSAIIKAFVRRPFSAEIMGTRIAWLWDHIEPPSGNCYTAMPSDKQAVYGFLKEIFGLFPANPSKQNRRDVFNALYQKSAFGTDVYERLSDRLNDYIREGKRAIAIIGQRGAGKTSFLNMWLHENTHHFLEQEQKILWFRVDASKLYNFRHSDVQSYFKVHAAYVIVVYATGIDPEASINPTFRDIMLKSGLDKKIGGTKHHKKFSGLKYFIQQSLTRNMAASEVTDRSVGIVWDILSHPKMRAACINFYDAFMESAFNDGYKVLAIIDGVDNLSASRADLRYVEMCTAVRHFIMYLRGAPNYLCLLLTRPGTIAELEIAVIGHNHHAAKDAVPFSFFSISIPRASIERIIEKKLSGMQSEALKGHRDRLFEKAQRNGVDTNLIREGIADKVLAQSIENYMRELSHSLQKVLDEVPIESSFFVKTIDDGLLEILFAGDIRAFFRALRQGIMLREYYATINVPHAKAPQLMLEIFMLCGSFYKVTRHQIGADNARRNAMDVATDRRIEESEPEWTPNIFWYDRIAAAAGGIHHWHGLSGLRILQLLHARSLTRQQIVALLTQLFDYTEAVLSEQIDAFHAFGLLRAEATIGKVSHDGVNIDYDIVYETTPKGRTIATLSLFYLKWQYFLALDTPLYKAFHPDMVGEAFLKLYRNPANPNQSRWHFFDASVSVCATFLRHFYTTYEAETARMQEDARVKKAGFAFRDADAIKQVFALPADYWSAVDTLTRTLLRARQHLGIKRLESSQEFDGHIQGLFSVK